MNLAVWCKILDETGAAPSVWTAQWRRRIGELMPANADLWSSPSSDRGLDAAATEIVDALEGYGSASSGRTSRLKRFLSIPRYDGASRKRTKRGKNGNTSVEPLVRIGWARTENAYAIIDDLIEPVVPVVQGRAVT